MVEQTGFTDDREAVSDGAALYAVNTTTSLIPELFQPPAAPVTFTGTLTPGSYTFAGDANAGDAIHSGSASYSADLIVEATPEPVALSVLGITALALIRRRQPVPRPPESAGI